MVNAAPSLPLVLPASGAYSGGVHYYAVRVFFEDTDAGGVVYHANYLRFMERARSDMLRLAGIEQRASLDAGEGVYAVTKVDIAYRRPAKLDDDLLIESRLTDIRAASCTISQRILRAEELLIEGSVTVAFITPQGRPRRQPQDWVDRFNRIASGEDPNP
jgi:acyl-CoA thioester hydrolase